MRTIGRRTIPQPSALPCADALRRAAVHQSTAAAMTPLRSTGIATGVYRFRTHAEAQAQVDHALARVMAANAVALKQQQ